MHEENEIQTVRVEAVPPPFAATRNPDERKTPADDEAILATVIETEPVIGKLEAITPAALPLDHHALSTENARVMIGAEFPTPTTAGGLTVATRAPRAADPAAGSKKDEGLEMTLEVDVQVEAAVLVTPTRVLGLAALLNPNPAAAGVDDAETTVIDTEPVVGKLPPTPPFPIRALITPGVE